MDGMQRRSRLPFPSSMDDLHARSVPIPFSGCWAWDGYVAPNGYGAVTSVERGGPQLMHRVAYEIAKGPIPKGLQIDHLCRVRCCINPDHLEAVTASTNLIRGIGPVIWSKRMVALNKRRLASAYCKHGHELTAENTVLDNGARRCRICKNRTSLLGYYRRKR